MTDYARRHPANAPRKLVAEDVAELVADRAAVGRSEEHVRDITQRLDPFARAFACPIASVTPSMVRDNLRGEKKQPLSGRSRDHARRMVVSLFSFARQQRYVTRELADEIAEIPAPKLDVVVTGIFTPDDMAKLLASAEASDQALLALGAFAGLRTAELHRLDWKDVGLSKRVIIVGADKAKTASRRVIPISDNLVEWLAPWTQAEGRISQHSHEHALSWGLMKVACRAGVCWHRSALRHSFCSYRLALTKNSVQVAFEAGNSPVIIHRHYAALVTESEAKAWFSIGPKTTASVSPASNGGGRGWR